MCSAVINCTDRGEVGESAFALFVQFCVRIWHRVLYNIVPALFEAAIM